MPHAIYTDVYCDVLYFGVIILASDTLLVNNLTTLKMQDAFPLQTACDNSTLMVFALNISLYWMKKLVHVMMKVDECFFNFRLIHNAVGHQTLSRMIQNIRSEKT